MTEEIKEIYSLKCNEDIKVKYYDKNGSIIYRDFDCGELEDYIAYLQDECKSNGKIIHDLQQRNEKAIEYIKTLKNYRFEFTFDSVNRHEIVGCEKNFVKDLLNILQGENDE